MISGLARFCREVPTEPDDAPRYKFGKPYTANTIHKILAHMAASFNRCRRGSGKKCIRGVVPSEKLLTTNPFEEVGWVEADAPEPRHFTKEELKAFLRWKV